MEKLKEQLKNRDVILGTIMIVSGVLIHFGYDSGFLGLIVYGLYQAYGKKEKPAEHHHHHHHHNQKHYVKKKVAKKKNG